MFDITGKRFRFFLISGLAILITIIALAVFGLKAGIEFTSGSLLTVRFEQKVELSDLRQELANLGHPNAIVRTTGEDDFLIRTSELGSAAKEELKKGLSARFGNLTERGFEDINPVVARQTASTAAIAVAAASLGILLYLAWAFRQMPSPFRYGTCAIIALLHDVLIVLGVFAILGSVLGWEIDLMFIVGILTVIGYSVNNVVIIFDRVRENLKRGISPSFETVVNNSLVETLGRSMNTNFTTLLTVLALLLFIGATIQNFAVALLVGIIAGTFDSICIAPMLLVVWQKREWGRFVSWLPFARGG